MSKLDSTPRYARITFKAEGKTQKWEGMITRKGSLLMGTRSEDDPKAVGGIILHQFYADVVDVVRVERMEPRYESWVKWEGWQ